MPSNKRPGSNADRHSALDSAEQAGQEIYLVFVVKPPSKSDRVGEEREIKTGNGLLQEAFHQK